MDNLQVKRKSSRIPSLREGFGTYYNFQIKPSPIQAHDD